VAYRKTVCQSQQQKKKRKSTSVGGTEGGLESRRGGTNHKEGGKNSHLRQKEVFPGNMAERKKVFVRRGGVKLKGKKNQETLKKKENDICAGEKKRSTILTKTEDQLETGETGKNTKKKNHGIQ